jgi:hypothetical protein
MIDRRTFTTLLAWSTGPSGLKESLMRVAIAALFALIVASVSEPSQADPYRWCAQAGKKNSCYYVTLDQCRAAISGNHGFCNPNYLYDGKPVLTPEDRGGRTGKRAVY